jgi:antitoxin (DNA-binding transcriptional repressor) of toxin-antitoxin stability system
MKRADVSTLKATLSACLAKVKAGDEVFVVERGKPIANWCLYRKTVMRTIRCGILPARDSPV